jgi:hypothetical protein
MHRHTILHVAYISYRHTYFIEINLVKDKRQLQLASSIRMRMNAASTIRMFCAVAIATSSVGQSQFLIQETVQTLSVSPLKVHHTIGKISLCTDPPLILHIRHSSTSENVNNRQSCHVAKNDIYASTGCHAANLDNTYQSQQEGTPTWLLAPFLLANLTPSMMEAWFSSSLKTTASFPAPRTDTVATLAA